MCTSARCRSITELQRAQGLWGMGGCGAGGLGGGGGHGECLLSCLSRQLALMQGCKAADVAVGAMARGGSTWMWLMGSVAPGRSAQGGAREWAGEWAGGEALAAAHLCAPALLRWGRCAACLHAQPRRCAPVLALRRWLAPLCGRPRWGRSCPRAQRCVHGWVGGWRAEERSPTSRAAPPASRSSRPGPARMHLPTACRAPNPAPSHSQPTRFVCGRVLQPRCLPLSAFLPPPRCLLSPPQCGYFAFGGSTIVLLFQRGAAAWDADLLKNRCGQCAAGSGRVWGCCAGWLRALLPLC